MADYLKTVQFATLADNRNLDPGAVAGAISEAPEYAPSDGQEGHHRQ